MHYGQEGYTEEGEEGEEEEFDEMSEGGQNPLMQ